MKAYLDILREIIVKNYNPTTKEYDWQMNKRTGENTIRVFSETFKHDMSQGFPLITTKKMALESTLAELEFFLKGYTDKQWLQDRKCRIWNEWGNPVKVQKTIKEYEAVNGPASQDIKNQIANDEKDLGPVYGYQWRHFGAPYPVKGRINTDEKYGVDQVQNVINTLRVDPSNRRAYVSAWNPADMSQMALPPCHIAHQVLINGDKLNLVWYQRSCDMFLGVPFNIASYAMLLLLYAKELGYKPGTLVGHLEDAHIYQNQINQVNTQLERQPYELPTMEIPDNNWQGMLKWNYKDYLLKNYKHHDKITAQVVR
ncbi:MAG: thymidylate synthase [Alphaproteobacteria bacterium]